MKFLAIAFVALFALWSQTSQSKAPINSRQLLRLSQVLRYSLEHSPAIISARSAITGAQAQKLAAVAAFLPSLSLTEEPQIFTPLVASGNSVIGGVVVPSGHGYNANVASANLSLNLFSGGKSVANLRASLAALHSADFGLTATLDTLFDTLLTDFAATSSDQITVKSEERVVALDGDLVQLTTARMQGRVSSEIDVIQVEQQLLQARVQLSQAREQWISDLEKVYTDMGLPRVSTGNTVDEWMPDVPPAALHELPVEEDPAVMSARAALAAAQEKVNAARGDYYPTVSLLGQYNYLGIDPSSMGLALRATRANNYSFGIEVTVPVLPIINVLSEVDTADAGVQSAEGQYQGALVSAANRVSDASERFREARSDLNIARRSSSLAQDNLRLTRDRYAARQASLTDVDDAELSAVQAKQSADIARVEFQLASWERYRSIHAQDFPTALLSAVTVVQSNVSALP